MGGVLHSRPDRWLGFNATWVPLGNDVSGVVPEDVPGGGCCCCAAPDPAPADKAPYGYDVWDTTDTLKRWLLASFAAHLTRAGYPHVDRPDRYGLAVHRTTPPSADAVVPLETVTAFSALFLDPRYQRSADDVVFIVVYLYYPPAPQQATARQLLAQFTIACPRASVRLLGGSATRQRGVAVAP